MTNQKGLSWLLFVSLALIWGSSFILMKKAADQLTGPQIGAVRIFAASLAFLPFALVFVRRLPRQKLPLVMLTGLLGNLFPAFLFGIAIKHENESSLAGILNSLTPLFVIVIGALFFKRTVAARKVWGVLLGFAGLALLSLSRGPLSLDGLGAMLLILVATILYGLNVNVITTYLKGVDPFQMATVSIASLLIPTGIFLLFDPVSLATPALRTSVFSAVLLGLMGSSAATALYYILIKKAGGLFASLVTYAIPIVAIFWGLLDGEQIGWLQFGCLGIILAGVYLANK